MENFVRMFMLLREVAVGVIRAFLEGKIIPDSFETFLQRHRHDLYHLCYNRGRCCSCELSPTFPTQAVIRKAQLDILFGKQPGVNCSRSCCCSFIATPNIQLDTIDITLCIAIINNLITLTRQQNDCLTDIRNVRNEISHFADEHDIDSAEFYRMWGKVTNASIHLAANTNHTADIQDKIERLRTRPILAVEYTESLREIVKWMKENDENRVGMEEILKRIETKIDEMNLTFKFQQTSNEHECELPYTTETQPKIVEGHESDNVIDEDDAKYFKLISDVHQLRQNGDKDTNDGMIYSVLVYIVLNGSATDEDVDYEVLTNIYNSIYKTAIPSETVSIESCLAELVRKYLDQIDEKFTPCSINIVKAVVYTFGNESCECFVQNCSLDVMMDYVVPSGTSTDDFHVVVDICVLACALVQRMKSNSDVRSVGKYIYKSFVVHENVEICNLFIDTLEQSNDDFTSYHMIYLLDGLTKDGTQFSIFDKLEKLFNLFCRQIDEFGNTVFHYLVTRFSEFKQFHAYIKFFCESNIVVMQLENIDNHTPIDFAAYQGRYNVIADVLSNTESTEEIIARILIMVKEGVELLQRINLSKSNVDSKLHISTKECITLGDSQDFENILDIIGRQENVCLSGSDTNNGEEGEPPNEEEEAKTPNDGEAEKNSNCSDDISKTVGDKILRLITDVKKGLKAISGIPDLLTTINQATQIKDEDKA